MKNVTILSFLGLFLGAVQAQNTSTNVNFGFNYSESNSSSTNTSGGVGVTIIETQSTPPPTQVIIVHETAPAPVAPTPSCAVNDGEMGGILESIRSKTFDDSQLSQAKTIIRNKCMTAIQIKQVMNVFKFEDSKLEIAKFAYQYVADKNNYYVVNDAFEFSSSADELNEYIGGN